LRQEQPSSKNLKKNVQKKKPAKTQARRVGAPQCQKGKRRGGKTPSEKPIQFQQSGGGVQASIGRVSKEKKSVHHLEDQRKAPPARKLTHPRGFKPCRWWKPRDRGRD